MTEAQLPLFSDSPIEEAFRAFHTANPHVLQRIIDEARTLRRAGMPKCGVEFIYARLRWLDVVETRGDTFRLNDHFTAYYARLAMYRAPDLVGFFETRRQGSTFDPATVTP